MKLNELRKGKKIIIGQSEFQIVEDWDRDFRELPSGKTKWYLIFGLIELKTKNITITHYLKISENLKEVYLINILNKSQEKINFKEITQRGNNFS